MLLMHNQLFFEMGSVEILLKSIKEFRELQQNCVLIGFIWRENYNNCKILLIIINILYYISKRIQM